jgi:hypothetical protein
MNRRDFTKMMGLGGTAIALSSNISIANAVQDKQEKYTAKTKRGRK